MPLTVPSQPAAQRTIFTIESSRNLLYPFWNVEYLYTMWNSGTYYITWTPPLVRRRILPNAHVSSNDNTAYMCGVSFIHTFGAGDTVQLNASEAVTLTSPQPGMRSSSINSIN